jgi:hypothetical protein
LGRWKVSKEEFKRLLLELLLEDPDVADAVLAARKAGEALDMADLHQHLAVSSPAYRRAREALRRLQEVER